MASFTVKFGGSEHQIPEGITVIGRHSECDIQISANGVSRQHVRFINEDAKLYVEDLGSKNGTLVNGVRSATRREVLKGDTVKVGEIEIHVAGIPESGSAAAPTAAPAPASAGRPAKPNRDDILRAMHRKKRMQNAIGLCILLLAAGAVYHFLIRDQFTIEEETEPEIVMPAITEPSDPGPVISPFDVELARLKKFAQEKPLAVAEFRALARQARSLTEDADQEQEVKTMVTAYETRAAQSADQALAELRTAVQARMKTGDFTGAETRLEEGRGRFSFAPSYNAGFDELQTAMLTQAQSAAAAIDTKARALMAGHGYEEALALVDGFLLRGAVNASRVKLTGLRAEIETARESRLKRGQDKKQSFLKEAEAGIAARDFEAAVMTLEQALLDEDMPPFAEELELLKHVCAAGQNIKALIMKYISAHTGLSAAGLDIAGGAGAVTLTGADEGGLTISTDEGAQMGVAWKSIDDDLLIYLGGLCRPVPHEAMLRYAAGRNLTTCIEELAAAFRKAAPARAEAFLAELKLDPVAAGPAPRPDTTRGPETAQAELTWPQFKNLKAPGGAGRKLQLKATRDVWLSGFDAKESRSNMGRTNTMKIKGIQEMCLIDFDFKALKGQQVVKAELHMRSATGARELSRLKITGRPDALRRIGVSTVSSPWEEGSGSGAYQAATGNGATFNEAMNGQQAWAWKGSKLFNVVMGSGNSAWCHRELKRTKSGWWKIQLDPAVIQAAAGGLGYGLCIMDDSGMTTANNTVYSRESQHAPFLVVEVKKNTAVPAAPARLQLRPYIAGAGLKQGAALLSLTVPPGALGYLIEVNGRQVEPWQVPAAGKDGSRQNILLTDLLPDKNLNIKVAGIGANGLTSEAVAVTGRSSGVLPPVVLKRTPAFKPGQGTPPVLGAGISVWAAPPFAKVDPVSGGMLYEKYPNHPRTGNSLWDPSRKLVRLAAARGDIISFQVLFEGDLAAVSGLDVKIKDLKNGGFSIPERSLRYFTVWYARAGGKMQAEYAVPMTGPIDLPFKNNGVSNQKVQAVLVDIFIPYDAPAGDYRGKLSLQGGAAAGEMDLLVPVYDTIIPPELNFNPELNCYGGPGTAGDEYFKAAHRLAHYNRCTINRVPYSQTGRIHDDMIPSLNGTRIDSWNDFDRRLGPMLDGSLFADNPRAGIPVATFYLPFFENWPMPIRSHFNTPIKDPADQVNVALKGPLASEGFSDAYVKGFQSVVREFVKHFEGKAWNKTLFEMYLNNKPRSSRHSSYWRLDEPMHFDDYDAIAWYGRIFKDALDQARTVRFLYRGDISRPNWQHRLFDGIMDIEYFGGSIYGMVRTGQILKERMPTITYVYGSCNKPTESNVNSAAWCLKSWFAGADGVLPWQSLRGPEALTETHQEALIVDARSLCGGPVASLRVKALKDGAQIVELLRLVQLKEKLYKREQLLPLVNTEIGLQTTFKQAFQDEAAAISFQGLTGDSFIRLKEKLLVILAE
jgi:hypothetical protein